MRTHPCVADMWRACEQAEEALGGLDKSSMIELKSFTKPHPDVLAVMQAVHALLARVMMPAVPAARKEWRHVRTMMAKIDHFQAVRARDGCALV